jgi:hypothetical protein
MTYFIFSLAKYQKKRINHSANEEKMNNLSFYTENGWLFFIKYDILIIRIFFIALIN